VFINQKQLAVKNSMAIIIYSQICGPLAANEGFCFIFYLPEKENFFGMLENPIFYLLGNQQLNFRRLKNETRN
jgi:hypothetical protein